MKRFPNLFPEDLPRVVQRSRLIWREEKWREIITRFSRTQERTASGIYNFIVREKVILICKASVLVGERSVSHIDLALGREVEYAGRLYFSGTRNRGILRKWTNESGHYRPGSEFNKNAGLPLSLFEEGQFISLGSIDPSVKKSKEISP